MPNQQFEPRFISLDQASSVTQLSTRTLRRAIKAGRLPAHRVGRRIRIEILALERWIRADVSGEPNPAMAGGTDR